MGLISRVSSRTYRTKKTTHKKPTEMGEQDASKVIDEKTKKNKDGNYASWLTGKEVKKLKKIKNKKKQIEKRLKALSNTESGRKAIEALKQKKLDQATMAKKSEMETM